jgi:holdfast attachment protein HfaA
MFVRSLPAMTVRITALPALATLAAAMLLLPTVAAAQSAGSSGMGTYQAGYGGSRYSTARTQTGSTRDANGNRLIVDGIIQAGASAYSSASGGVSSSFSGAGGSGGTAIGGSTAIGNSLNVVVQGNHNTVIVNSTQVNNGTVTAGTSLNGTLRLP